MDVESNTSNKEQAEAIKARANKEFSAKNFESATELYSEAIALDPSNALLFGNRAASRIMLEQFEGALEDAARSVELDPSFVKGYVRMGKCYLQLGRLLESKRAYQQALELEPAGSYIAKEMQAVDNVSTIIEAAKEKLNPTEPGVTPEPHTALRYLQRAIAICGEIPAILLMQAEAALMEKDYDLATKIATGLLHKNPDNPEALYIRGLAYYYNAKFPLAVNHFKQVLARDPDHSKARSAWRRARDLEAKKQAGNEAFQSRDFTSAAQLYTEALAIDPELTSFNSILHYNRGASRYQLADYQGCYDDCSKAIEYNEDYGKAYAKRAAAALKLEKYEESVRDYQRAYEMDPDNRNLKQELKQAKLELKKSKRKDYYKILGVAKDADENQIKKAYHKQALKHHPDRHQGDESKEQAELMFKEVGEAYAVLSDPQKRRRYDSGQDLEEIEGHGGVNPADIFAQMFGGGGGFGGFGGGFGGDFGGFGGGFGGGHHHFGGGGGGGRRGHPFGF